MTQTNTVKNTSALFQVITVSCYSVATQNAIKCPTWLASASIYVSSMNVLYTNMSKIYWELSIE